MKYEQEIIEIITYFNKVTGRKLNPYVHGKHITSRINQSLKTKQWDFENNRAIPPKRYEVDDFKRVIDSKYGEWIGTSMEKYIRPETLFSGKFDGYLKSSAPLKVSFESLTIDKLKEMFNSSETFNSWIKELSALTGEDISKLKNNDELIKIAMYN